MNYIVYKTTNLINGKIYVGIHKTDLNKNQTYIGCGVSKKDLKKKVSKGLPSAIHKYGYDNFKQEILFTYPYNEDGLKQALNKEAEIVTEEFIKRSDTYNLVPGGIYGGGYINRKKIAQYDGDNSNIDSVQTKEKSIYQFDLQGNLLKRYKSISEAATQFENKIAAKSAISQTCLGKHAQAYGYYWSFKNKFESKKNNHLSSVAKYNDNGEFLESYNSIKEAADSNNIKTPANIIAAIRGSQKRCGGFRWRYFYGNTSNIKPL